MFTGGAKVVHVEDDDQVVDIVDDDEGDSQINEMS